MDSSSDALVSRPPIDEALLHHAAELLAEGGLPALTARELGQRVGATTRVIYSRFGGMPQLTAVLYARAFQKLRMQLSAVVGSGELRSDLISFAQAYRRFAIENPRIFELMYGARAAEIIPTEGERTVAQPSLKVLVDIFEEHGRTVKAAREDAYVFWAAIHGPVSLEVSRWIAGPARFDRVVAMTVAALLT